MITTDPAAGPEHICNVLGELAPECDGYYCNIERELLAEQAALAGGETALPDGDQLVADVSLIVDFELGPRP